MDQEFNLALLEHLNQFVSDHKKELFDEIIENRTKHFTVILEDIFQPHNASAVLRSCDCFGIQEVNVIENENPYQINKDVALGSSQWLDINKHNQQENNTVECFNKLKAQGYKIVATTPHTNSSTIETFDISQKSAFVFGTELKGLSDIAMEHADEFMKIPMYGFTESFNISVSAAIILNRMRARLNASEIDWQLTETEKTLTRINWAKETIKKSQLIVDAFILQHGKK